MELPPSQTIINATPGQYSEIADILADAFQDDPIVNWLVEDRQFHPRFFAYMIDAIFRKYPHIYVNEEGTGAALWLPPGVAFRPAVNMRGVNLIGHMTISHGFAPLKRIYQLDRTFARSHPKEPHFYLHAIGARLNHQGKGIGSALLKHVTRQCDEQGVMAYLESSNKLNNPLYERHGFEVVKEVTLPDGPPVWLMERPVRP